MNMPATFQSHPYAWGAGAAVIALYLVFHKGTSSSSASTTQTAVASTALDPTAAALSSQQMQTNAQLTEAQISAQTQTAGLTALQEIVQANDSTQVQVAGINANVANAQTAASIFGTATNALTVNNELAGNSSSTGYSTSGVANGTALVPGGPGWQSWMDPFAHSGISVPITSNTPTATNATNNQISELFNNVIRAGQGTAPLQTVTMQDSGTTVTGSAIIDPVFAVWDGSSATPAITDVTLNGASQYGYTGSVYTPGSAAAVNITPNATPNTATNLPTVNIPPMAGFQF